MKLATVMFKRIFQTWLFAVTCFIGLAFSLDLQAGQQFASGSLADSPPVGVAFKIPAGFNGTYNAEVGGLIVQDSTVTLAVFGVSQGEVNTAGDIVVDLLRDMGIQLQPIAMSQPSTDRLDATFSARVDGQPRAMIGTVRQGSYRNIIAVIGMSQPGQESAIESAIDQITATLQWSQPRGGNARQKLAGISLYRSGGSSDGYSGTGGFSAVSSSKQQIDFCSNGQYLYQSVSESIVSTETASMPSSSSDRHQGNWWLVADLGGNQFLYLESNADKYYIWPIHETNDGASVNGQNYSASKSQLCY